MRCTMTYTDLIFDLYGTLVDIHTEESAEVWEKTALYFGFYGARCTGAELKRAFEREMAARQAKAGQSYECFPDIPFEQVMDALFRKKGICTEGLGQNAALLDEQKLDPARCLMIGNDRETDIAGAVNAGLATLYLHTGLTPPDQEPADPARTPGKAPADCRRYEYEGDDWAALTALLCRL